MKCIYLNMYKNNVGMIGLGSWGKNIYRNLETLNVLEKIYDSNSENLNNTVTVSYTHLTLPTNDQV